MEGQTKDEEEVPRLSLGGSSSGDRLKRDEWTEGAVTCLLEAYESKWILRNRAKLKGQDWEDVARQVSSRRAAGEDSSRSSTAVKTATQCKNKVESMKKRYRNEVAAGSGSRWPLFSKLDGLVRCRGAGASTVSNSLMLVDEKKPAASRQQIFPVSTVAAAAAAGTDQLSRSVGRNGEAVPPDQEDRVEEEKPQPTDQIDKEEDQNTPSCNSSKEKQEVTDSRKKKKQRRSVEEGCDIVIESIELLGGVILRAEQTRMETMKEVEKIRAETEARKGEMELKRTEIIANTQIQIARLFARSSDKVVSNSSKQRRD